MQRFNRMSRQEGDSMEPNLTHQRSASSSVSDSEEKYDETAAGSCGKRRKITTLDTESVSEDKSGLQTSASANNWETSKELFTSVDGSSHSVGVILAYHKESEDTELVSEDKSALQTSASENNSETSKEWFTSVDGSSHTAGVILAYHKESEDLFVSSGSAGNVSGVESGTPVRSCENVDSSVSVSGGDNIESLVSASSCDVGLDIADKGVTSKDQNMDISNVKIGSTPCEQEPKCTAGQNPCACVACIIANSLDVEECIAMTLGVSSEEGQNMPEIDTSDFEKNKIEKQNTERTQSESISKAAEAEMDLSQETASYISGGQVTGLESAVTEDTERDSKAAEEEMDRSEESASFISRDKDTGLESTVTEEIGESDQALLEADEHQQLSEIEYCFSSAPKRITGARDEYKNKEQNFLKGCKWSPDGTCLLTNSDDNQLRLFNLPPEVWSHQLDDLPDLTSVLKMKEGDLIYDYCWYPRMSSQDPASCCLVSSCRDNPIHMWDAFNGDLRCTYRPYDNVDEITSAYSVTFSNAGDKLYCGFNGAIRIFDVNRPGRECRTRQNKAMVTAPAKPNKRKKKGKAKKTPCPKYQRGILSCIALSPDDGLYAVGSYSKTVSVYCAVSGEMMCLLDGHSGGVTQIKFSPDGNCIYSGGRKDPEILCWDIRSTDKPLFSLRRMVETNQRMYFDLDRTGRFLVSGNHDGTTSVWDLSANNSDSVNEPTLRFRTHNDTTNGVSLHPYLPLLATGSGQQHVTSSGILSGDSSESDADEMDLQEIDNSLQLWWLGAGGESMDLQ